MLDAQREGRIIPRNRKINSRTALKLNHKLSHSVAIELQTLAVRCMQPAETGVGIMQFGSALEFLCQPSHLLLLHALNRTPNAPTPCRCHVSSAEVRCIAHSSVVMSSRGIRTKRAMRSTVKGLVWNW